MIYIDEQDENENEKNNTCCAVEIATPSLRGALKLLVRAVRASGGVAADRVAWGYVQSALRRRHPWEHLLQAAATMTRKRTIRTMTRKRIIRTKNNKNNDRKKNN